MDSIDFSKIAQDVTTLFVEHGLSIIMALVVLYIGFKLVKYVVRFATKSMKKAEIDDSLINFLEGIIKIGLKVLIVISVAAMVGIETTAFLTVLGAAGLAIGLALQGSLSNFAGGILILIDKPFVVGDIIETQSKTGEVEKINILNTHIREFDNKVVIVPNGQLFNSLITNLTLKEKRRISLPIGISYESDIAKARSIVLDVLKQDQRILDDPAPEVIVKQWADSSVNMDVRVWAKFDDLYSIFWDNMERIKVEFDKHDDISIPFPQRDVHLFEMNNKKN